MCNQVSLLTAHQIHFWGLRIPSRKDDGIWEAWKGFYKAVSMIYCSFILLGVVSSHHFFLSSKNCILSHLQSFQGFIDQKSNGTLLKGCFPGALFYSISSYLRASCFHQTISVWNKINSAARNNELSLLKVLAFQRSNCLKRHSGMPQLVYLNGLCVKFALFTVERGLLPSANRSQQPTCQQKPGSASQAVFFLAYILPEAIKKQTSNNKAGSSFLS